MRKYRWISIDLGGGGEGCRGVGEGRLLVLQKTSSIVAGLKAYLTDSKMCPLSKIDYLGLGHN